MVVWVCPYGTPSSIAKGSIPKTSRLGSWNRGGPAEAPELGFGSSGSVACAGPRLEFLRRPSSSSVRVGAKSQSGFFSGLSRWCESQTPYLSAPQVPVRFSVDQARAAAVQGNYIFHSAWNIVHRLGASGRTSTCGCGTGHKTVTLAMGCLPACCCCGSAHLRAVTAVAPLFPCGLSMIRLLLYMQ
jgi:hypothetical protein